MSARVHRMFVVVTIAAGHFAAACGPLGSGGDPKLFVGTWMLSGGPVVSCPNTPGVMTSFDEFTVVEGTDYPLVLNLRQGCALKFSISNQTATLAPNQSCALDTNPPAGSNVEFTSGELGASSDGSHLNVDLAGKVTVQGDACTYSFGASGAR